MKFNEVSQHLRTTFERYGGGKHFLEAASDLDKALSAFFTEQTVDSLRDLNGAYIRAWRCRAVYEAGQDGPAAG
jgi:hypothetical protein